MGDATQIPHGKAKLSVECWPFVKCSLVLGGSSLDWRPIHLQTSKTFVSDRDEIALD